MLPETYMWMGLVCAAVIGAVLRSVLGWLNTGEKFDWKAFLKTTIPSVLVSLAGVLVLDIPSIDGGTGKQMGYVLLVLLGSAGFGSLQSKFI